MPTQSNALSLIICILSLNLTTPTHASSPLSYDIISIAPHDPNLYTQGLACQPYQIYESSGLYGKSSVIQSHWPSMQPISHTPLSAHMFGEDLTLWQGTLWQLTWREHLLIRYDLHTLKPIETYRYQGEGWGLTHNEDHFIMSDGSHCLQIRDSVSFRLLSKRCIYTDNHPLGRINAMDFFKNRLFVNLLYQDNIAVIDYPSGNVIHTIDLSKLRKQLKNPHAEVLNGVCALSDNTLVVTGKKWDKIFHIQLKPSV